MSKQLQEEKKSLADATTPATSKASDATPQITLSEFSTNLSGGVKHERKRQPDDPNALISERHSGSSAPPAQNNTRVREDGFPVRTELSGTGGLPQGTPSMQGVTAGETAFLSRSVMTYVKRGSKGAWPADDSFNKNPSI